MQRVTVCEIQVQEAVFDSPAANNSRLKGVPALKMRRMADDISQPLRAPREPRAPRPVDAPPMRELPHNLEFFESSAPLDTKEQFRYHEGILKNSKATTHL